MNMRTAAIIAGAIACACCACGARDASVKNDVLRYGEHIFPSDDFKTGEGEIRVAGLDAIIHEESAIFARHLASLDGFGLRPLIELPLAAGVDPETIDPHLVDPAGNDISMEWRFDVDRNVLAGAPALGVVLAEGTTYSVAAGDVETRFTTQHATRTLVAARALLDVLPAPALSFPHSDLIFSTEEALDRLLGTPAKDDQGRERLGWSNPTGVAHAHVGVIAHGVLTSPRFKNADEGYEPTQETFEVGDAGGIDTYVPKVIDAAQEIPVTLVLPKAPPKSADGYPLVILGHGFGASRHAVLTFAEPLTEAGFAIAAIDFDGHGSRFNPADRVNNTAGVIANFTGDRELHDGFGDLTGPATTLALLHNFKNLSAVRDSIRQSVLDLSSLAIALRGARLEEALPNMPNMPNAPNAPKLDARRIAYLGESFGSVVGAVFAGVEPSVDLFVLDVPGGGVVDLEIAGSPGLYAPVLLLARSVYGFEGRFDRFQQIAALSQAIVDGADPLSYAPLARASNRSIVALEVLGDEVMSNVGTRALAHALELDVLLPALDLSQGSGSVESPAQGNRSGVTRVLVEYSPATHGANWSSEVGTINYQPGFPYEGDDPFPLLPHPIEIRNPIRETFEQVTEILTTHLEGAPRVRSTLAPVAWDPLR